jgi:hypothetical protein
VSLLEFSPVNLSSCASYRHDGRGQLSTDLVVTSLIKTLTKEALETRIPLNPDIEIKPTILNKVDVALAISYNAGIASTGRSRGPAFLVDVSATYARTEGATCPATSKSARPGTCGRLRRCNSRAPLRFREAARRGAV